MNSHIKHIKIKEFRLENINRAGFFIPICHEETLYSYFKTIGKDIKSSFIDAWSSFCFDEKGDRIADMINFDYNFLYSMESYSGIKIDRIIVNNSEDIVRFIDKNLEIKLPSIIHLDTYYSYWGMLYLKEHTGHIVMACDHDKQSKKYQ